MTVTFVTGLFDFEENRSTEKSIDKYMALFETLRSTNLRFHVFVSPRHMDKIRVKNGIVEPMELSSLDTYTKSPNGLPENRNVVKDSRNYLILMNAKVELVKKAILSEKHDSQYYAWIDFGISHIFRDTPNTLKKLSTIHTLLSPNKVYVPGCLDASNLSFDSVDWRFCGGFFIGDRSSILDFYSYYERYYSILPKLTWEINVWSYFEQIGWEPFWYKADHNDSMFDIPSVMRIPSSLYLYWHGELSKCYVGGAIESCVRKCNNKHLTPIPVVFMQNDSVDERVYNTIKKTYPNSIVAGLCTRNFWKDDILLLPLDDETLQYGLTNVLSRYADIPWEEKKPIAFWRGGTSGYDDMTPRMRVVDALLTNPNTDVRFTRGASHVTDSRVSPEKFAPCRVGIEDHLHYKYIFIIDGNVIASSHQWIFGSGSVPIMVTHPDNKYWFQKFLQPMKNYVPIEYDLSDLNEKIEWLVTHDKEAKDIADNSMYLAKTLFSSEFQMAYIENELNNIYNRIRKNKTIGVAIPCYKYHIPKLTRCLDSIEAQTIKPNKVVVLCSSSEESDIPNYKYSFPLHIVVRSDRRNAAQNRNQAASLLDTDIISFFDADDIMHPQRIEYIQKHGNVDIVLHSYITEEKFTPYTHVHAHKNSLAKSPSWCAYYVPDYRAPIHHAHVSCRRHILNRVRFREEVEFQRTEHHGGREDAVFCGDVLALEGITSCYIAEPLSCYFPEGMTIESPST